MKRRLEIGPAKGGIRGFERLGIDTSVNVDYLYDASEPLPFDDDTFHVVYASHVLEHISWEKSLSTLKEWVRITSPSGQLEVWVPDGLQICEMILKAEKGVITNSGEKVPVKYDRYNPYLWANWRLFNCARDDEYSKLIDLHKSVFTPNYITELMKKAGCKRVWKLAKPRKHRHGICNMGFGGKK